MEDFMGFFFTEAGGGVVVAAFSTVMLSMSSCKLLFCAAVHDVLLMASAIATSISSCSSVIDSSSIRIFSFPLLLGVTSGSSSCLTSSSISPSLSSSSPSSSAYSFSSSSNASSSLSYASSIAGSFLAIF